MRSPDGDRDTVHLERHPPVEIIGRGRVGKLGHVLQFVKAPARMKATAMNGLLRAGGAAHGEGEVAEREAQAVLLVQPDRQTIEFGRRDVGDGAAFVAHGGNRSGAGPSVGSGPVAEVHVFDHPDLLEVRERPVHGREVDVVVTFGEFLRGDPAPDVVQVLEQHPSRPRDPTAPLAHPLHGVVERQRGRGFGARRRHVVRVDGTPPAGRCLTAGRR